MPRFTIVLFKDDDERWRFRSSTTGGEYIDQPWGDLERSPTLVLSAVKYGTEKWWEREALLHER